MDQTRSKYVEALNSMKSSRSFSAHKVCRQHGISCTVATIARQLGWISRLDGSRKLAWVGPRVLNDSDIDGFLSLVRDYKRETRKCAPSMKPGARQERAARTEKFQGRRTDRLQSKVREYSFLFGLIKFKLSTR